MRWLVVVAVVLAGHGVAHACKGGPVIFRQVQTPLPGHEDAVPDRQLEIRAGGRWGWVEEMPDGQEPASHGGCLSGKQLEALKRALARARFRTTGVEGCDAVSTMQLEYAAPRRKKKVAVSTPCGETLDARTRKLVELVRTLTR